MVILPLIIHILNPMNNPLWYFQQIPENSSTIRISISWIQDGAPKIAFTCPISVAQHGRYNELVTGSYFMVYKPTNISGGPHPVLLRKFTFPLVLSSNLLASTAALDYCCLLKDGSQTAWKRENLLLCNCNFFESHHKRPWNQHWFIWDHRKLG